MIGVCTRHWQAFLFVLTVILPCIVRSWRRPVIFSRYAGLGDVICTVPAARELMKRHPGAAFIYNCHADFTSVARLAGIADHVTSLVPIGLIGHWYRWLLAGFYHFANSDDVEVAGEKETMVAEFCRQFSVPVTEEHPLIEVSPLARSKVLEVLAAKKLDPERLVLIHPGPSWPVREWPGEKWERLVKQLRQHGFTSIGQLGVGRYVNFGAVEVPVVPGAISLLDQFTVEECFAVISQAKLFVGIDSGLLHIAAATRTLSVGIFGMTFPEFRFAKSFREGFVVTRVECAGCEHRKPRLHWITGCPHDIRCMWTLDSDEVLQACLRKLQSLEPSALNDRK